jgi:hypothetical protein
MVDRFKQKQDTTQKKILDMKQKLDQEELSTIQAIPNIKKVNFKLENVNFYNRMEIKKTETDTKKRNLIEKELQRRMEESKINPNLNKKLNGRIVKEKINSIYQWDDKRKEKLKNRQSMEDARITEGCTFRPAINLNSKKIAEAQIEVLGSKNRSVSQRLFKNEYLKTKNLLTLYDNMKPYAPELISMPTQNDYRELERNLMKHNPEYLESLNSRDETDLNMRYTHIANTPTTINTAEIGINLNPKILESISVKESKIIEELLKQRMIVK